MVQGAALFTFGGIATGETIASIANAVAIMVLNGIYSQTAVTLNNWENHRTETMYEDALIAKIFLFQLINSYAALVSTAFVKYNILSVPCVDGSCTGEVNEIFPIL